MTEDIKILLDEASGRSSPSYLVDTELVVARGRRRVRRRGFALAGGTAAAVAVVTAAAVIGASAWSGANLPAASPPAPPASVAPPPDYTLPALDPDKKYIWYSDGRQDDTSAALITEAIRAHFEENFPDAKAVVPLDDPDDPYEEIQTPLPLDDPLSGFAVSRYTNRLIEFTPGGSWGSANPNVHEEPVYRLWSNGAQDPLADSGSTNVPMESGALIAFDGEGADRTDALGIALYPAGGYAEGGDGDEGTMGFPFNGHLTEGCKDFDLPSRHGGTSTRMDFTCKEKTGPNGERILTTIAEESNGDGVFQSTQTVVVIRDDGTAVVVTAMPRPGVDWEQGQSFDRGTTVDLTDLTGMALAVPLVPFGR